MFLDTYALMEFIEGNKSYEKLIKGIQIVTTRLNLMEMHYNIIKNGNKEKADFYYNWFLKYTVEVDDRTIKLSNEFRMQNTHKKFSYIDCLGYTMARMHGLKFLTGDNAFKGMEGVEYIK